MRIGLLITRFPDQTAISMWRVGQAMRELGHEVFILSTRRPSVAQECHRSLLSEDATSAFYSWPPSFWQAFVGILRFPPGVIAGIKYIFRLNESSLREKLRLMPLLLSGAATARYCRRHRLEHIFVHSCADAAHLVNIASGFRGPSFSLRLGGDLQVYGKDHASKMRNAALVVAAARCNKDEVHRRVGLSDSRVIWTWLGVDTQRFVPLDLGQNHDDSRPLKVATIARLHPAKGHIYAIQAIEKLVSQGYPIYYTIAGRGSDAYRAELLDHIKSAAMEDRIRLVGSLDEFEVISLLQESDAFLLPSVGIGEASPVAVLEAMSCGTVPVCTVIGGTPDMVNDGIDGFLVPQRDPEAIAKAFVRLCDDPSLKEKIAITCRKRAEREFDCRIVAGQIISSIQSQLNHS